MGKNVILPDHFYELLLIYILDAICTEKENTLRLLNYQEGKNPELKGKDKAYTTCLQIFRRETRNLLAELL